MNIEDYKSFESVSDADIKLAIGYRVRSNVGMQFRNWTSKVLKEYMQKGFVMNDERLKNPKKIWG